MEPIEVRLTLPLKLGAVVASKADVQKAAAKANVKIASVATPKEARGTFRDFGATAVVLLGTVAAGAAVKGLFDVIKTVVQEAYKTHRQKQAHQHEQNMLMLKIGEKTTEIDLDQKLEDIEALIAGLEQQIG